MFLMLTFLLSKIHILPIKGRPFSTKLRQKNPDVHTFQQLEV